MADKPDDKTPEVTEVLYAGADGPVRMVTSGDVTPEPQAKAASVTKPVSPPSPPSPGDHGKILAQTVVKSIIDRLNDATRKNGGYLSSAEVAEFGREMETKTEALEKVFQQSLEQYVRARERAAFDHARQFPFDRVIVNTFASLFDPQLVKEYGADAVTRQVLPGFFLAIDKMLGPELMEEFQVRCRAIVERLSPEGESGLDWNVVYVLPEVKLIVCDALVEMLPYFEDIEKRQDWLLAIVNDNLTTDSGWQLSPMGFYHLFDALFSNLRRALTDFEERRAIETLHGIPKCEDLDRCFSLIDVRMRRLIEGQHL